MSDVEFSTVSGQALQLTKLWIANTTAALPS